MFADVDRDHNYTVYYGRADSQESGIVYNYIVTFTETIIIRSITNGRTVKNRALYNYVVV